MLFLRSGGARLKSKLTLRSFSELSRLKAPASDGVLANRDRGDPADLAQRIVSAMRSGDDEEARGKRD